METRETVYDIWTDGSFRPATGAAGGGWIVRHKDHIREGESAALHLRGQERAHGSDVAEVFAVASALRGIPPGAYVYLRLDCKNVVDWLNRREINIDAKKNVKTLCHLFGDVMSMAETFENFHAVAIGGNSNAYLDLVHRLSKQASAPRFR